MNAPLFLQRRLAPALFGRRTRLLARLALALTLWMPCTPLRAQEEILWFDSQVTINVDGSLDVSETLRVRVEGNQIRHGIYRDFPTAYRDAGGHRYHVDFEFIGATRDGLTENAVVESISGGTRIYLGWPTALLDPREYVYVLRYRTTRQLGFFESHDELYWNVTGNGWVFPINSASATVTLPGPAPANALRTSGYTGVSGARGGSYRAQVFDGGARFVTTAPLDAREGLTVVLQFPRGMVIRPTSEQQISWFVRDNAVVGVGIAGLAVL